MHENGTESGGVDAPIPVTETVDASGYEKVSRLDPQTFWAVFSGCGSGLLLVATALGRGLVAFGSAPSSVPFRWGPTPEEKGHRPQNRQCGN